MSTLLVGSCGDLLQLLGKTNIHEQGKRVLVGGVSVGGGWGVPVLWFPVETWHASLNVVVKH